MIDGYNGFFKLTGNELFTYIPLGLSGAYALKEAVKNLAVATFSRDSFEERKAFLNRSSASSSQISRTFTPLNNFKDFAFGTLSFNKRLKAFGKAAGWSSWVAICALAFYSKFNDRQHFKRYNPETKINSISPQDLTSQHHRLRDAAIPYL